MSSERTVATTVQVCYCGGWSWFTTGRPRNPPCALTFCGAVLCPGVLGHKTSAKYHTSSNYWFWSVILDAIIGITWDGNYQDYARQNIEASANRLQGRIDSFVFILYRYRMMSTIPIFENTDIKKTTKYRNLHEYRYYHTILIIRILALQRTGRIICLSM